MNGFEVCAKIIEYYKGKRVRKDERDESSDL